VQTVATMMALANQPHCIMLKDVCIEFMSSSIMDDLVASQGFAVRKKN
jgi:speckle-type POZ protein